MRRGKAVVHVEDRDDDAKEKPPPPSAASFCRLLVLWEPREEEKVESRGLLAGEHGKDY